MLKEKIANLYADIYSSPPWNEQWTLESALKELDEVMFKPNFTGVLAEVNQNLIGFSWGYQIPESNTSRVDFEKIRSELEINKIDSKTSFYGAETGVKKEFRRKGLATLLITERTQNSGKDYVLFRTKNPQIVRIYSKTFGEELFSFPEESSYKMGRVYVMRVEK